MKHVKHAILWSTPSTSCYEAREARYFTKHAKHASFLKQVKHTNFLMHAKHAISWSTSSSQEPKARKARHLTDSHLMLYRKIPLIRLPHRI